MANVSLDDIITALATKIEAAHSALSGRVYTRRRLMIQADPLPEIIQTLTSLNSDGKAQGIVLEHTGWDSNRDAACNIHRNERFAFPLIYPYNDDEGGVESATTFQEIYDAIRNDLDAKANHDLGLGNTVLTGIVQSDGVFEDRYSAGEQSRLIHVCLQSITVRNSLVL